MNALQRHALLWPQAQAWPGLIAGALQNSSLPPVLQQDEIRRYLALWAQQDWPLVVARQNQAAMRDGVIALGLSLPPLADGTKPRLALQIALEQVQHIQPPLSLVQVLASAQATPAMRLTNVSRLAAYAQDLDLRVYGSWSWQVLTGLQYIQASSDIDLLFTPDDQAQLQQGSRWFELASQELILDGELVFPMGRAVAWREWQRSSTESGARVLIKDLHSASLQDCRSLWNSLASTQANMAMRECACKSE